MRRRLAFSVICATLTFACSSPPDKERQQAEEALAAARNPDVVLYAPDKVAAAETALKQYADAVAARDYRQALNLAIEARDQAHAAVTQATADKAIAHTEADKLAGDLDQLIVQAKARLSSTQPPRLSPQAADQIRAVLKHASTDVQDARTRIGQQDFRGAAAALTPLVDDLRRLLSPPAAGRKGK